MNSKSLWRASLPLLLLAVMAPASASDAPDSDYVVLKGDSSVGKSALDEAIAPLFDNSELGLTQSVLVMHKGEVLAERYGDGIHSQTKLLSRSIAKAVTTVLVGLMVSDGRLALDSPVPLAAWNQPGDPRGLITLRHLLTMSSGLQHREMGEPLATADSVRMLFTDGAQDMAAFAEAKPVADRPGSRFTYSTADTMIVSDLMTRMLTDRNDPQARRDAMEEYIEGRLAAPVGLPSLTAEYDARGTMIGGAMMHMTTRDYARFGQFLMQKGRIDGKQIVSPRWVEFMTRPSRRNPAYGGGLWLNREGVEGEDNPLFPGKGPRSLFACVGHNGQYIIVSPAQGLVIVRMGVTTKDDRPALANALAELVALFPSG